MIDVSKKTSQYLPIMVIFGLVCIPTRSMGTRLSHDRCEQKTQSISSNHGNFWLGMHSHAEHGNEVIS
ncbi:hypothetical protein VQ7734_03421 [Vibrio quintilis]|uniref:Uncharacterized protein n=1 Tax=Vibrio quintilis TaxID=1117707 RepID=A0A1M7YYD1_9VIBR|nr:hypothetical protein VQ7734_03421 [Vibrio quintilis]